MDKDYSIISAFECNGKKMLVIRMSGAACVLPEDDFNRIITDERRYKQNKSNAA